MVYLYGKINAQMTLVNIHSDVQSAAEDAERKTEIIEFVIVSDEHDRGLKGVRLHGEVFWRITSKTPTRSFYGTNYNEIGKE